MENAQLGIWITVSHCSAFYPPGVGSIVENTSCVCFGEDVTVAHQTGPINSVVLQCSLSSESLSWCLTVAHQTGPINSVVLQCSLSSESLSWCLTVAHQTGPINSLVSHAQCSLSSESLSRCLGLGWSLWFYFPLMLFCLVCVCFIVFLNQNHCRWMKCCLFMLSPPFFFLLFLKFRMCFDSSLFAFAGLFVYEKAIVCSHCWCFWFVATHPLCLRHFVFLFIFFLFYGSFDCAR